MFRDQVRDLQIKLRVKDEFDNIAKEESLRREKGKLRAEHCEIIYSQQLIKLWSNEHHSNLPVLDCSGCCSKIPCTGQLTKKQFFTVQSLGVCNQGTSIVKGQLSSRLQTSCCILL